MSFLCLFIVFREPFSLPINDVATTSKTDHKSINITDKKQKNYIIRISPGNTAFERPKIFLKTIVLYRTIKLYRYDILSATLSKKQYSLIVKKM